MRQRSYHLHSNYLANLLYCRREGRNANNLHNVVHEPRFGIITSLYSSLSQLRPQFIIADKTLRASGPRENRESFPARLNRGNEGEKSETRGGNSGRERWLVLAERRRREVEENFVESSPGSFLRQ